MIRPLGDKIPKIAESAFISEAAYVIGDVEIGENSSVWPGAVIRGDMGKITIGSNTAIEDNCVIHSGSPKIPWKEDVTIGDNVVFGHGSISNGKKIGNYVLIGIGAKILHDVEIGDYSLIAAGSVATEKMLVPEKSLVMGIPGKIRGQLTEEQMWWSENSPKIYVETAQLAKKEKGLDSRD